MPVRVGHQVHAAPFDPACTVGCLGAHSGQSYRALDRNTKQYGKSTFRRASVMRTWRWTLFNRGDPVSRVVIGELSFTSTSLEASFRNITCRQSPQHDAIIYSYHANTLVPESSYRSHALVLSVKHLFVFPKSCKGASAACDDLRCRHDRIERCAERYRRRNTRRQSNVVTGCAVAVVPCQLGRAAAEPTKAPLSAQARLFQLFIVLILSRTDRVMRPAPPRHACVRGAPASSD